MKIFKNNIRSDLKIIAEMIEEGSRVLDIGCGDGELLEYLCRTKQVDGRGIELSMDGVGACVSQGLSVIQGDADTDLFDYPNQAFDYVVLSQTLQATRAPRLVLKNLLRIGKRAIVSFPNFGFWRVRLRLFLAGRMPVTQSLPDQWYDTPNIHLCTIRDFVELSGDLGITIEKSLFINKRNLGRPIGTIFWGANLMGEEAVFLLSRKNVDAEQC